MTFRWKAVSFRGVYLYFFPIMSLKTFRGFSKTTEILHPMVESNKKPQGRGGPRSFWIDLVCELWGKSIVPRFAFAVSRGRRVSSVFLKHFFFGTAFCSSDDQLILASHLVLVTKTNTKSCSKMTRSTLPKTNSEFTLKIVGKHDISSWLPTYFFFSKGKNC